MFGQLLPECWELAAEDCNKKESPGSWRKGGDRGKLASIQKAFGLPGIIQSERGIEISGNSMAELWWARRAHHWDAARACSLITAPTPVRPPLPPHRLSLSGLLCYGGIKASFLQTPTRHLVYSPASAQVGRSFWPLLWLRILRSPKKALLPLFLFLCSGPPNPLFSPVAKGQGLTCASLRALLLPWALCPQWCTSVICLHVCSF